MAVIKTRLMRSRHTMTNTRNITRNINTILIVINMMIFSRLLKKRVLIIV